MRAGVFFGPGDDVLVLSCAGEADGRKDVGEGSTSVGTDGCLCAFKIGSLIYPFNGVLVVFFEVM